MVRRSIGIALVSLVCFRAASGVEFENYLIWPGNVLVQVQKHDVRGIDFDKYVIAPPDFLRILAYRLPAKTELLDGEFLVRPDGNISLGKYGTASVAGLTVDRARETISKQLNTQADPNEDLRVRVEVAYTYSKKCYVIVPGENGETVHALPYDGRATVASAVLEIEGLAAVAAKDGVWISRPAGEKPPTRLKVDWQAITGAGQLATNHRLEPGDRVFVGAPPN